MKTKIYIDGSEGTTGLRIYERFQSRDDIELLTISQELRKDYKERKRLINESDITFLCLPDDAAIEAVSMVEKEHVKIIDASTAHRTEEGWAYGFPELSEEFYKAVRDGKRIAVPGCYPTGFNALTHPLIREGILSKDYPVVCFAMSGYSGGGKKTIAAYEDTNRDKEYDAPREYALSQQHKHLKEMKAIAGLERAPVFSPIIADYYSGMLVSVPLYGELLKERKTPKELRDFYAEYYAGKKLITVQPFGAEEESSGFLSANARSGWDGLELYITGNEDRIILSARLDNLGKGASGAAIQCLNIMMGCEEEKGLNIG